MADNNFDLVLVWDNLGGAVRINRGGRATVTDPATGTLVTVVQDGQSVTTVTADENGRVSFVAQQGQVKLLMDGLAATYISAEQAVAGAANAAAAQSAQVAAESARDAAIAARDDTVTGLAGKVGKGDLVINVADYATPQAALDAAPAGSIVYYPPATYAVPAGGYVLKSSGLTIEAMGATFNVSDWGTPAFLALRSNGAGDDHTFRIKLVQYIGTRGDHTGTLRGSATYCSGCAVWTNGDRNFVEKVRTIGMPTPVFFSSYDGASSTDRTGTGNRIGYLEAEGYDFAVLYVKQIGFDLGDAYCHDDIDDSAGANPTHAIYCSAGNGARAGQGSVGRWLVKNHVHGVPFMIKYADRLSVDTLSANASTGVLTLLDTDDFNANRVMSIGSLATAGGAGAITMGYSTAVCKRPVIGQIDIVQAAGVNEKAVSWWADDGDATLVKITSNRSITNAGDGELVVRGSRNNFTKVRTYAAGSAASGALLGFGATGAADCCIADIESFGSSNDAQPVTVNAASTGSRWARRSDHFWGAAAPTTGTWKVGARVDNVAPAVGSAKGWVCTVAGTPGTWVSVGNL